MRPRLCGAFAELRGDTRWALSRKGHPMPVAAGPSPRSGRPRGRWCRLRRRVLVPCQGRRGMRGGGRRAWQARPCRRLRRTFAPMAWTRQCESSRIQTRPKQASMLLGKPFCAVSCRAPDQMSRRNCNLPFLLFLCFVAACCAAVAPLPRRTTLCICKTATVCPQHNVSSHILCVRAWNSPA